METQCQHLTMSQCNDLPKLLQKSRYLFDGTLGTWKPYPVDFKLKEDANPFCLQPYLVPKVHEEISKNKIKHLFLVGLLEAENDSEWGFPSFAQPTPK